MLRFSVQYILVLQEIICLQKHLEQESIHCPRVSRLINMELNNEFQVMFANILGGI